MAYLREVRTWVPIRWHSANIILSSPGAGTMGVQVSTSRFQWPSVVSGAMTRKGPGLPSSCRWNSRVAIDCAVLPRPCARGSLE